MALQKRLGPARYRHSEGPRIADELSWRVSCGPNSELQSHLQVRALMCRFGVAPALAALIASLAFGEARA